MALRVQDKESRVYGSELGDKSLRLRLHGVGCRV